MTLDELIKFVDEFYPDGHVLTAYLNKTDDYYANYIVDHLKETFDPIASKEDQIATAMDCLCLVADKLKNQQDGLSKALGKL